MLFVSNSPAEGLGFSCILAVYCVHCDKSTTLLDRLELGTTGDERFLDIRPRVERHSRRVFIPYGDNGVIVTRLHGDRLVWEKTLSCVNSLSMDAMSPDTVYVFDKSCSNVCAVDIREDRITSVLKKPDSITLPYLTVVSLAVLGDSIMVSYSAVALVFYRHGSPAPLRVLMLTHPLASEACGVRAISTDCQRHFLGTSTFGKSVYVIDVSGNLRHRVGLNVAPQLVMLYDSVVVNGQLWVLSEAWGIFVLS